MKIKNYSYSEDFLIDSSMTERRKKFVGDIYLNQAKCLLCGDVILSRHLHDYVACKCDNLAVDGGSWYAKRVFKKEDSYEEMSIYYNDSIIEDNGGQ